MFQNTEVFKTANERVSESELRESLRSFCKRYQATVSQCRELRSYTPHFSLAGPDLRQYSSFNYETVSTVDINLPERLFTLLIESINELDSEDYQQYKYMQKKYKGNFMGEMRKEESSRAAEHRTRSNNESVRRAWENYQMLLKLAGG